MERELKRGDPIARVSRNFHMQGWSVKMIVRELHVSRTATRRYRPRILQPETAGENSKLDETWGNVSSQCWRFRLRRARYDAGGR